MTSRRSLERALQSKNASADRCSVPIIGRDNGALALHPEQGGAGLDSVMEYR